MKRLFACLLLCFASLAPAEQLHFEGIIPADVDKTAMTAEYYRIYRIVAPRQRPDPSPLRVVYYSDNSSENFDHALPEWGGGGTIGGSLIVVPTTVKPFLEQSFAQITRHELVHAVLARAYPGLFIPRWFHEGTAMTLSGELSFQENVIVSKAIFTNSLMSLASIDSVNNFGRNRADLAYSQSHLAVLFLIEQYGIEVLSDILYSARKTGSFWQGVHAVLSLTPSEFELLARKDITSRYQLVFVFADYYAFWVVVVFLFLIAFGVTVVRKQKKMALMEREERDEAMGVPVAAAAVEPPRILPAAVAPPPAASSEPNTQPDEQIDVRDETYAGGEEGDDEYYDDEDEDDDYILADGVELEDEDFADENQEFHEDEGHDDGEGRKP
jgi:hypothetical protein